MWWARACCLLEHHSRAELQMEPYKRFGWMVTNLGFSSFGGVVCRCMKLSKAVVETGC